MTDYVIMNISSGDMVGDVFETREEAENWIKDKDIPENYEVIERD